MGPRLGWAVEWTPRAQERVPGLSEAQREDEPCESGCVSCRVYLSSPACRELAHWPCGLPRGGGGAGLRLSCAALKPCGLRQVLPPCLGFDVLISKPETPGPAAGGREESARRPGARRPEGWAVWAGSGRQHGAGGVRISGGQRPSASRCLEWLLLGPASRGRGPSAPTSPPGPLSLPSLLPHHGLNPGKGRLGQG